jgi:hypothetical protein
MSPGSPRALNQHEPKENGGSQAEPAVVAVIIIIGPWRSLMTYTLTNVPTVNGNIGHISISGRGLLKRKLTRTQRVRLAADLVAREARLDPSIVQASDWLNVSPAEVSSELKARAAKSKVATLVSAWDAASEMERADAFSEIGPAAVWDVLSEVVS